MKEALFAIVMGLGLMAGLEKAGAQEEEKPTPKPPYLAPVPDYGHWTVTFKYENAPVTDSNSGGSTGPAAAKPPVPATVAVAPTASTATNAPTASTAPDGFPTVIDTIKTGDLRGVVLTFSNGTSRQFTCQGDWVLTSTAKGAQVGIVNSSWAPYVYYTTGFILLDGVKIDLSTFKETAKHNGVLAFHYKSGDADVWISIDSMLPLTVKRSGVEVTYQFLNPPPRPFPIPQDQESLLQKEQQAYQSTKSMR